MDEDFNRFLLKEFSHWNLFLHKEQFPYLGRCYAWAVGSANLITEMGLPEREELFERVIPSWDKTMKDFLKDAYNRPNLAIFGNTSPHLHAHLIPRLKSPIERYGLVFADPNSEGNYSPYPRHKLKSIVLENIKSDILLLINNKNL